MPQTMLQPDLRIGDFDGHSLRLLRPRRARRVRLTLPNAALPLFHAWRP